MPFISTTNDHQIYYETHGTSNANPAIVFLSGFFGIADIWRPLATQLSKDYVCISYDNRGFGRSSSPTSSHAYSIEAHAQDVLLLLDSLQITDPVLLVTHSMGGNTATAFTLAHPARVAGIVYTGTYFDGRQFGEPEAAFLALTKDGHVPSKVTGLYAAFGLDEDVALEAAKWCSHAREANARALLAFEMRGRYSYADIAVPTMVVQGRGDVVNPLAYVYPLVEALPHCRLVVLDGVNHFPPTEAPEKLEGLVREFAGSLSL